MAGALEKNRAEASHRGMGMRGLLKFFGLAPPVLALVMLMGGGSAEAGGQQVRLHAQRIEQQLLLLEGGEVRLPGRVRAEGLRGEARSAAQERDRRRDQEGGRGRSQAQGVSSGSETKTVSAKVDKGNGDNGKAEAPSRAEDERGADQAAREAARRLPQAAPGRAFEERRRAAQRADAHTALTFAAGAAAKSSKLAACAGAGAGLPSRSAMIWARAA